MNDLNNTQLVLLALLVSFVTSIATGIVTVTLLDQAPPAVTQTINRVVEKTVEVVTPSKDSSVTQTVVVKEEKFVAQAAEKNSPNVVQVGSLKKKSRIGGFGKPPREEFDLMLRQTGFVLNNQFAVSQNYPFDEKEEPVIVTNDNHMYRTVVVARNTANDVMILKILEQVESAEGVSINTEGSFSFVRTTSAKTGTVQIGQTAIALGFSNNVLLSLGVVSQIETTKGNVDAGEALKEVVAVHTTIDIDERYAGGPLLNTDGEVIGINAIMEDGSRLTVPIHSIDEMIERAEAE